MFECKECGKTFQSQQVLDSHTTKHTGILPLGEEQTSIAGPAMLACEFCPEGFFSKFSFDKHQKAEHADKLKDVKPVISGASHQV